MAIGFPIKNALYGPTKTWEFVLDGIYHNDHPGGDESQFWLQWKYFDETVPSMIKSQVGWYVVKLDSPDDSVPVAAAIDKGFANSSTETKTETESAFAAGFAKQLGNIELLILTIGGVVFFTLLLVTGNTMAISVRERVGELAVLKAIGYPDRYVLFFVLSEALVIALIGGLIGLGLAVLAIPVVGAALRGLLPPLSFVSRCFVDGSGFRRFCRGCQRLVAWNRSHAAASRGCVEESLTWPFQSFTIFAA